MASTSTRIKSADSTSNPVSRKFTIVDYSWYPLMFNILVILILLSLYVYFYKDTPSLAQIGLMGTSTHRALR